VSLFRRRATPVTDAFGREVVERVQGRDRFVIPADGDGRVRQPCWFCGEALDFDLRNASGDVAIVMIERFDHGDPLHGICHSRCAERARHGSA